MSGLLERIVRRRRASASSRLGPPAGNGALEGPWDPHANGSAPEITPAHVNGSPAHEPAVESVVHPSPPVGEPADPDATKEFQAEVQDEPAQAEAQVQAARAEVDEEAAQPAQAEVQDEPAHHAEPAHHVEPAIDSGFRERGRMRRRARYLQRLREIQLRDLGGFILELHRFQREHPDLVAAKLHGASQTDLELRALQRALGERQSMRELREAGIGGACWNCGAVHGSEDRFCASCGEQLASPPAA